jgi:virulence factor Mce-like protein
MRRVAGFSLLLVAVAATLLFALQGDSHPYLIKVGLADAAGLREQSPVMIGGVQAGTVSLHVGAGDQVVAELNIDRAQIPVGKNASVAISAVNFLGQKEAELTRGNIADPAPSGYLIPASQVTVSTDLDQVLDVLDSSTRMRLALLINEAGTAFTGRRGDFSQLLGQLPHSLVDANALLSQLVSDNHTLAHVVATGNQFVAEVAGQRTQLSRMIDAVGQTAVTVAARRAQLAQTLADAPATLVTLQAFLG